jgi:glutamate-1-semialdehyde 2,1-aminomutase
MMTVFFSEGPVTSHRAARQADRIQFARWARGLLRRGILVPPSPLEGMFLSAAHTESLAERVVTASAEIWRTSAEGKAGS